uniref:hypothetical protein n=1 Tax=Cupriavidus yeoncheonensis TaxID=1462994 RepID=UPI003F494173
MNRFLMWAAGMICALGVAVSAAVSLQRCGAWGLDCAGHGYLIFTGTMLVSASLFWVAAARLRSGSSARAGARAMAWLTTAAGILSLLGLLAAYLVLA